MVNVDVAAAAAMAAAASNKSAAVPSIAQQFSSIPGATTIQLIPVSMAAQIRGAAALGQNQGWVPLAHHGEHHRAGASDQKSPNDARQQTIGVSLSSNLSARLASTQDLEYLFAPTGGTNTTQHHSSASSMPIIPTSLLETFIKLKHDDEP